MSQEENIPPRPLRHIPNASEKARQSFADALIKKGVKMSPAQAETIARALVDPKAAQHALRYPQVKRIPSGNVTVVQVEVLLPALSLSPINPRENEQREYPVGLTAGTVLRQLDVKSGTGGQAASLVLTGDSRAHIEGLLRRSADFLRAEQAPTGLKDKVAVDGILKPLTLAMANFVHADTGVSADALIAIDGSSRLAVSSELTGTDPVDAIYRWPHAPRQLHSVIGQLVRVQKLDPSERTEKAEQAHRALTALADIIVEAVDLEGAPLPLYEACRALMSDMHVEKPHDWPEGGQRDQLADAVLSQLEANGYDPVKVRYFAGTLSRSELPSYISPELDVRAAEIVSTIFDPSNNKIILRGIRTVVSRKRVRAADRPEIATELVLRALRTGPQAAEKLGARRASMSRTITDSELIPRGGNVGVRAPEVIRELALAELSAGSSTLQRDRQELGFLGGYWLVALDALRRDNRQPITFADGATEPDSRTGAQVVKEMLETREGIHQLYQAIIDGRAGRGRISEVDERGVILPGYVEDLTLRNRFKPQRSKKAFTPTPKVVTAAERLAAESDALLAQSRDLVRLRDRILAVEDELTRLPLVMVNGLDSATASEISTQLRDIAGQVDAWGAAYNLAETKRQLQRELDRRDSAPEVDPVPQAVDAGEIPVIDLMEGGVNVG